MRKLFNFTPVFFVFILLASCNNGLVPMITENPNDTKNNGEITTPADFRAIGGKRKITLEWTESENATSYEIYAARTQFDDFIKVGDSSSSSFVYKVSPGLTRYFKIVAQNDISGKSSEPSQIVKGYSLATPVISEIIPITSEETGNKTTVYWFMENVEDYQDLICYEVICYDENLQIAEQQISGAETTQTFYTFENLPQNKNLQFEVQAYFQSEQNEIETSGKMDARTAAMQTPKAVESFTATEGTSKDTIELSFKLPETAYIKVGTTNGENVYDQYPLYFVVYRRIAGEENWTPRIDHLYFDGTQEGYGAGKTDDQIKEYFEKYVPGAVVDFKDESLPNGTKFEYKIQSYIDNYFDKNNNQIFISSERISVATSTGWTCGIPYLKTDDFNYDCEYDANKKPTKKLSATLDFKARWNNFGNEEKYGFILETLRKQDLTAPTSDLEADTYFDSIKQINDYCRIFDLVKSEDEIGYYSFKLYVVPKNVTDKNQAIAYCDAAGTILVTNAVGTPTLTNFEVISGYAKKVIVKWEDEESTATVNFYSLSRCTFENNKQVAGSEIILRNISGGLTPTDNFYTYEDENVESGKQYEYTLIAEIGSMQYTSGSKTAETLGTPVPKFDENNSDHKSIKLTWDKVQQADDYEVTLKDENDNPISATIEKTESGNTVTYEIKEPAGFNDATKSGQTWTATVTAKNNTTSDSTVEKKEVRTLGPALTSPTTTPAESADSITVTWNVIPGAKSYAVKRTRYDVTDKSFTNALSTDVYTVSNIGTVSGGSNDKVKATIEGNKIKLIDEYKENKSDTPSDWDKNQDMLAWGFPYRYTIIPLKDGESIYSDGKIDSGVTYLNLNDAKVTATGSCKGYGHNVTASKSEDPYNIIITWDEPYGNGNGNKPDLWLRESGTTGNWIKADYSTYNDNYVYTPKGTDRTKAFDFAISYDTALEQPQASYIKALEDTAIKNPAGVITTENTNKGYAFAIELNAKILTESKQENSSLRTSPSYTECFTWKLWDYNKRLIGPTEGEKYVLSMKNNDFANGDWKQIATINQNGAGSTISDSSYKVSLTLTDGGIEIAPTEQIHITNDNATYASDSYIYNGLLKIMRDYKHYGQLIITRINSAGQQITASYADDGTEVFAYRNITDTELIRATTLVIAQALVDTSALSSKECSPDPLNGKTGTFTWTRYNRPTDDMLTWNFNNYEHKWSETMPSFIKLSDTNGEPRGRKWSENKNHLLRWLSTGTKTSNWNNDYDKNKSQIPITVTLPFSQGYTTTIVSFRQSDNKLEASVTKDDFTTFKTNVSTDTDVKYWSPITIGNDSTSTDYRSDTSKYWK